MIADIPDTAIDIVAISVESLAVALFIESTTNGCLSNEPAQDHVVRVLWDRVAVNVRRGYRARARRILGLIG